MTLLDFGPNDTPEGSVEDGMTFNIKMLGRLGWLYFHRFESTGGLGFYVRPAYTAEFATTGVSSKPDDRESDKTDSASVSAATSITSLRHGPWLDLGAVW